MDQRLEDITQLRQAKKKLEQIESLKSQIQIQKNRISDLQKDAKKPGHYEILPTNTEYDISSLFTCESSKKAGKITTFFCVICILVNVAIFVFTIFWLRNSQNAALVEKIVGEYSVHSLIGHYIGCVFLLLVTIILGLILRNSATED